MLGVDCTGKVQFGVSSRVALGRPDSALAVGFTGKARFGVSSSLH